MNILRNPSWADHRLLDLRSVDEIPESLWDEININLKALGPEKPAVSVVIPAYNEEVSILGAIHSLSRNQTSFATEIIVVNNNSTDRTQQVLDKLAVKSVFQSRRGCGPARQAGQQCALGKYILMADADCFYPPGWIQKMTETLIRYQVPCVYGRYSFFATEATPRWKLFLYETMRDVVAEFRHVKRPCLNAVGMSMGYVKALGLKTGFVDKDIRGEDGRMCLQLQQFGRVMQVRDSSIRVWTMPRKFAQEGGLLYSLFARIALEISRVKDYFTKQRVQDVYKDKNYDPTVLKYFQKYRKLYKE